MEDAGMKWPKAPTGYSLRHAEAGDREAVAGLMTGYFKELGLDLDPTGLDADVADPAGGYAGGGLILAVSGKTAVGVVGLREWSPGVGEVKRMYLLPGHRGGGLGRALMEAAVALARAKGFGRLVLDTRLDLKAANALYERAGFRDIADYNNNPRAERFMALELGITDRRPVEA